MVSSRSTQAIILPDGVRLQLANIVSYSLATETITFNMVGGGTVTYVDPNGLAVRAQTVLAAIDSALAGELAAGVISIPVSPLVITSITPTSFDIATDTLTIIGSGFDQATLGKLHIEDVAGGFDFNGYYMNLTFVSSTQLTAVFGSAGDGVLSGGVYIMYKDTNGLISNVINGTNTSGSNITIP